MNFKIFFFFDFSIKFTNVLVSILFFSLFYNISQFFLLRFSSPKNLKIFSKSFASSLFIASFAEKSFNAQFHIKFPIKIK